MLLIGVLLVGAAGCSSQDPAPVDPAPLVLPVPAGATAAVETACRALLGALPQEIDPGVARRAVEGTPARLAAWGEPPVVLECGVAAGSPTDPPVTVNGVEWTVRDTGDGFLWSTIGRTVNVSVAIPGAYENGAELVNPLAAPVERSLPAS